MTSTSAGRLAQAYEGIREAIVEGRYLPGTRLIEQSVAAELELSRTPVREALKTLAAEGLVSIEPNVGATVRTMDRDTLIDLYELRARLEGYAARRAAARRTDDQIARMREGIEAFGAAVASAKTDEVDSVRPISAANSAIHSTIVEAAHHEQLAVMIGRAVHVPLVFHALRRFDAARLEHSNLFHRLIVDAIEGQEGERAERLMIEHVDGGRDVLLEHLDRDA